MQGYLVVISYNFPAQVYPRIFVGNKAAAECVPFLTSLGIVLPPPQYPSPYRQQNYDYITRGSYCYCYHSSPPWYWQFFISSTFALFPITFPKSLHLRHHPCAQPCLRPTKNVRCHLIAHLDHSFHQSQDQLRNPHHQKHRVTTYHHDYASYFSFFVTQTTIIIIIILSIFSFFVAPDKEGLEAAGIQLKEMGLHVNIYHCHLIFQSSKITPA